VPLIEIPHYDFGALYFAVFQNVNQLHSLLDPFGSRGSKVNIVNMNQVLSHQEIYPLTQAWFIPVLGQIISDMPVDGKTT
jgi:hypothetical protein